jgi:hypothetical protein
MKTEFKPLNIVTEISRAVHPQGVASGPVPKELPGRQESNSRDVPQRRSTRGNNNREHMSLAVGREAVTAGPAEDDVKYI